MSALSGIVATSPRYIVRRDGSQIAAFRLAVTSPDAETDWYTVTVTGELARFVDLSVHKGERVTVTVHHIPRPSKGDGVVRVIAASITHAPKEVTN